MLSVVTWKWATPGYRSTFTGAQVNALARMVASHYPHPHRVVCVTNDAEGIDPAVTVIPDAAHFANIPSPHGGPNPSCYRRLLAWHPNAAQWFGERFVCIDLDVVAVADLSPLWNRTEDVVLLRDPLYPTQANGSMVLMTAGARPQVWNAFDPAKSPAVARGAGFRGSDQGWISYCLRDEATWGPEHGVYSYRKDIMPNGDRLPDGARMVVMHGFRKPWDRAARSFQWVQEHYYEDEDGRSTLRAL